RRNIHLEGLCLIDRVDAGLRVHREGEALASRTRLHDIIEAGEGDLVVLRGGSRVKAVSRVVIPSVLGRHIERGKLLGAVPEGSGLHVLPRVRVVGARVVRSLELEVRALDVDVAVLNIELSGNELRAGHRLAEIAGLRHEVEVRERRLAAGEAGGTS